MNDAHKETILFVLDKIQKDVDRLDEKQDDQLVTSTKLINQLESVSTKVVELNKLLTQDNGKPSILSQLNNLSTQLSEAKILIARLHSDLATMQQAIGLKTPKEVTVEKWKTVGKVGAGIAAVIPGILSFVHTFFYP